VSSLTDLMEFDPSTDDEEKYSKVIAPYFLNALNKMSRSKTWERKRKMDVFGKASKAHLGAFTGDEKELKKYLELKGSDEYSALINPVINYLVGRNFITLATVYPAEIMITQEGIDMCNREGPTGWHFNVYQIEE
jgi:hypothetical protein